MGRTSLAAILYYGALFSPVRRHTCYRPPTISTDLIVLSAFTVCDGQTSGWNQRRSGNRPSVTFYRPVFIAYTAMQVLCHPMFLRRLGHIRLSGPSGGEKDWLFAFYRGDGGPVLQ